ncbi:molybdenum cofactor biosynthesis protein MoaE [Gymnodinialimonas sp. 2305UL16-5]|uniref:molybdenum cofactor biosynthesis protein MoaE n=1 Tax=Gymnodinialimonas mytili TaxID=3126503 RepID=UPI0030B0A752
MSIRVQDAAFDMGAELNAFSQALADNGVKAGAIVSFCGVTRDVAEGDLDAMVIEHYPGMTEAALGDIRAQAMARFSLAGAMIVHRYGRLAAGEIIMMVATAAPHRADAFAGAEFLMDYLKSRAPFWKKEITTRGESWVDAKDTDEAALKRW